MRSIISNRIRGLKGLESRGGRWLALSTGAAIELDGGVHIHQY